jgi:predicted transcriptional regulator
MEGPPPRRSVFPGFSEVSERRANLVAELTVARQRLGLSQADVAARMGTSQPAVARLESGGSDARLSTIERYSAALGVALEWRLVGQDRG